MEKTRNRKFEIPGNHLFKADLGIKLLSWHFLEFFPGSYFKRPWKIVSNIKIVLDILDIWIKTCCLTFKTCKSISKTKSDS
jgi:hypothetical protein